MEIGIIRRWERFVNSAHGNSLIVPLDHGFSMEPIEGINSFADVDPWLRNPAIDAVVAHKGLMKHLVANRVAKDMAVCLHINGTSTLSSDISEKPLLLDAEMAVRYGVDAISLDLIFSPDNTARNFSLLGSIARQANHYGLPILVIPPGRDSTLLIFYPKISCLRKSADQAAFLRLLAMLSDSESNTNDILMIIKRFIFIR